MSRHTVMNYRAPNTVRIPDLMGGINTREALSMINDNQLTDSLNMWWYDGALKTRPGINKIGSVVTEAFNERIEPRLTDVYICGERLFYYSIQGLRDTEEGLVDFWETSFWLLGKSEFKKLPFISYKTINFVCQKNNTVYAFTDSGEIWKLKFVTGTTEIENEWERATEKDYYVPLVMGDCKFIENGGMNPTRTEVIANGVMYEGYNILGDYYKMEYSMYNPLYKNVDTDHHGPWHYAYYGLLNNVFENNKYVGMNIEATITLSDGTSETLKVEITEHSPDEADPKDIGPINNGKRLMVTGTTIHFCDTNGNNIEVFEGYYPDNNLVIKAPYIPDNRDEMQKKVFNMTQSTWFGGASAGLKGGTRLFLCGNKNEKEKALVMWSGLNEPLYFSENTYFYVGDTTQAVTGFGKQSDMLVIFKERGAGTFYTKYVKNDSITASDLINQAVIDYSSSAVYFPLTQIHDTIGCDIPSSIQLCRNRLVWANSDGKVYTLVSNNQYSERNVYCVSDMIGNKLKQRFIDLKDLNNVFSADWEGHYLLFINSSVFVMDYESYGYVYAGSHTKTEDAQKKIPWWYWEFKDDRNRVRAAVNVYNELFIVSYPEEPNGRFAEFEIDNLDTSLDADNYKPIHSMLQTKLFDFSMPAYKKNVQRVNLSLGNNGGEPIRVEFITEYGSEEQEIIVDGEQTEARTAGYITNRAVFPCIKSVKQLGVRLSCEGNMAADGMSLDYVILGGAR